MEKSMMKSLRRYQTASHLKKGELMPFWFSLVFLLVFESASFLFTSSHLPTRNGEYIGAVSWSLINIEEFQGQNPVTGELVLTARNQNLIFSLPLVGSILGGMAACQPTSLPA